MLWLLGDAGVPCYLQWVSAKHLYHRLSAANDTLLKLPLAKRRRDDAVDDHRRLGIGQPVLQAIPDLDTQAAFFLGNYQQRAIVFPPLTYAPVTT